MVRSIKQDSRPLAIHGVLQDELERIRSMVEVHHRVIADLPKGSIRVRKRGEKEYHYLHFRGPNGKVCDSYIKGGQQQLEIIKDALAQRKHREKSLKQLLREKKSIEKLLRKK